MIPDNLVRDFEIIVVDMLIDECVECGEVEHLKFLQDVRVSLGDRVDLDDTISRRVLEIWQELKG